MIQACVKKIVPSFTCRLSSPPIQQTTWICKAKALSHILKYRIPYGTKFRRGQIWNYKVHSVYFKANMLRFKRRNFVWYYFRSTASLTWSKHHASFHLCELCWAVRNSKPAKNTKWKKILDTTGFEPPIFRSTKKRLLPLGHLIADKLSLKFILINSTSTVATPNINSCCRLHATVNSTR